MLLGLKLGYIVNVLDMNSHSNENTFITAKSLFSKKNYKAVFIVIDRTKSTQCTSYESKITFYSISTLRSASETLCLGYY